MHRVLVGAAARVRAPTSTRASTLSRRRARRSRPPATGRSSTSAGTTPTAQTRPGSSSSPTATASRPGTPTCSRAIPAASAGSHVEARARSSGMRATRAMRPARISTGRSMLNGDFVEPAAVPLGASRRSRGCTRTAQPYRALTVWRRSVHVARGSRASIDTREANDGGHPCGRRGRAPLDPLPGPGEAGRAVRRQVPDHRFHAVELQQLGHRRRRRPDPVQPPVAQRPHRAGPAVGPRPQQRRRQAAPAVHLPRPAGRVVSRAPPTRSCAT